MSYTIEFQKIHRLDKDTNSEICVHYTKNGNLMHKTFTEVDTITTNLVAIKGSDALLVTLLENIASQGQLEDDSVETIVDDLKHYADRQNKSKENEAIVKQVRFAILKLEEVMNDMIKVDNQKILPYTLSWSVW